MVLEDKKQIGDAWEYDYEDERAFGGDEEYIITDVTNNAQGMVNQGSNTKSKSACTIFGCVNAILHLFNISLSVFDANQLALDAEDYCIKNGGYVAGKGWWVESACKYVTKWRNETQADKRSLPKIFYLRRYWNSPIIKEALEKGHYIGFSKTADWYDDKVKGLIDKGSYPDGTGHRLNFKSTNQTKATSGLANNNYDVGVHDNYEGSKGQQFFIKDRKTYINKGINAWCYLFLPEENMVDTTIEEKKDSIEIEKAVNALIGTLSTTWGSLPKEFQDKTSALASDLRKAYPNARKLVNEADRKAGQNLVDELSFLWKFFPDDEKNNIGAMAKHLREKFNLL